MKQLELKDEKMKNQLADMKTKISENFSLEIKQPERDHERRNKNKSQDIFQNQ